MKTVVLGHESESIGELIKLLKKNLQVKTMHELHDFDNELTDYENLEFTREENWLYYKNMLADFPLDFHAAAISYAAQIDNTWYFLPFCGWNDFDSKELANVTILRKFCFENQIRISCHQGFRDWFKINFPGMRHFDEVRE